MAKSFTIKRNLNILNFYLYFLPIYIVKCIQFFPCIFCCRKSKRLSSKVIYPIIYKIIIGQLVSSNFLNTIIINYEKHNLWKIFLEVAYQHIQPRSVTAKLLELSMTTNSPLWHKCNRFATTDLREFQSKKQGS